MATAMPMNKEKLQAFAQKAIGDVGGTLTVIMCSLGDRLGLFKALGARGPATSVELAAGCGLQERYVREWLSQMAVAGYLEYDPGSSRFTLPPEHAAILADEAGPMFLGGLYHFLPALVAPLERLLQAFREGGGVHQSAYDERFWEGLERFTGVGFENFMLQLWIPAVPGVQRTLDEGALVADVGCGTGRALIKLAQAYPKSRYVGYDVHEPAIARATAKAQAAGVSDRVSFRHLDVSKGLPDSYDLITTFDVVHDSVDPRGLLRAIRGALKPDGTYLVQEINCQDRLEQNIGPLGAVKLGASVLYCMTTSLANGGVGLGTIGLPESRLREYCREAGFESVRRIWENPFRVVYEVRS
jgi:2-polyprenyl-3-methyl-5-hydroxy-6-metoxy-1,4-benzoquinol methylase